ncbi:DUF6497 family protein [Tabrizicola sp.]|uniref:DUF6497 family protein n=1 Tax=Tabrizicola sp. TaxID=2005166 RepID=UPI00286C8E27|nr:DUF6497 family protein [Tabrizicola sp.]
MRLPLRLISGLAFVLLAGAGGCEGEAPSSDVITVPSGREVQFLDVITNAPGPSGSAARFRFVVPGLSADDAQAASADMQALCDTYALPRTEGMVPKPQQIIISLAASATPFGEAAPDVTQFFEAYTLKDDACIWEVF